MTSPLPPTIGSSPFPFLLPGTSPFPTQISNLASSQQQQQPSPLPWSIPSLPSNPPSVPPNALFPWTANSNSPATFPQWPAAPITSAQNGLSGLPGTNANTPGFLQPLQQQQQPFQLSSTGLNASSIAGNGGSDGNNEYGTLVLSLESFEQGLERCLVVLEEIKRMEDGLFVSPKKKGDETASAGGIGGSGRSEGMEVGTGGLSRLELLHLEYTQLLTSLIALSTSTHLASLPSPFSQVKVQSQTSDPAPNANADTAHNPPPGNASAPGQNGASTQVEGGKVSLDELTEWAEKRANLEFGRREALRISAKTVLDVLSKR